MQITKEMKLLMVMAGLYCSCFIVSNIIVGKPFNIAGVSINTAMILFPIVYIINDVVTEVFGYKTMRTLILAGFICACIASLAYEVTIIIPSNADFQNQEAFEAVLGSTPRVLFASLMAYLIGSTANAKIMQLMKQGNEKALMARCIASTAVGESVDAVVFYTLGFAFVLPIELIVQLAIGAVILKTAFETVVYPVTRQVVMKVREIRA